jgi:hypothetical protein
MQFALREFSLMTVKRLCSAQELTDPEPTLFVTPNQEEAMPEAKERICEQKKAGAEHNADRLDSIWPAGTAPPW